ncbi:response regulator transcription factor [Paenibacillus aestuarii]|uniref:Response regulator transcription factor n=1 Tax=Paenibacillus aestuarii TaxID=516965 RepID=A0ABW0KG89_9BACL|nr:response regulator transcription factor [Paenibacillus aestuarii]
MTRILVVEDEEKIARLLQLELVHAGYSIELAHDGLEGLHKAIKNKFDLILLDILLPRLGGFDLIKSIREVDTSTPIIFVTACEATTDIVNGLDLGGQDYVTKPFQMDELLARIRANLRARPLLQEPSTTFQLNDTRINLRTREVTHRGENIELTAKEFELLVYFIEHPNKVLSQEKIMNDVWKYDFFGNSNLIAVYIRYLRKKLPSSVFKIKTIRGTGYCFEVNEHEN